MSRKSKKNAYVVTSGSRRSIFNESLKGEVITALAMEGATKQSVAKKFNLSLSEVKKLQKVHRKDIGVIKASHLNGMPITYNDIRNYPLQSNPYRLRSPLYNTLSDVAEFVNDPKLNPVEDDQQTTSNFNAPKEEFDDERNDDGEPMEDELKSHSKSIIDSLETVSTNELQLIIEGSSDGDEKEVIEQSKVDVIPSASKKSSRIKVTDEVVSAILDDLKQQCYTQRQIAEKHGVSASLISNIKNGTGRFKLFAIDKTINESTALDKKLSKSEKSNAVNVSDLIAIPTPSDDTAQITNFNEKTSAIFCNETILSGRKLITDGVKVGMIAGRHPMPVNTYIFDNVYGKMLTDFNRQYDFAYNRIKELVDNHYGSDYDGCKILVMYVTGLTSVLATIIKACMDLKINLRLLHYNPNRGIYMAQNILTQFGSMDDINICPAQLQNLSCRRLYTYGCTGEQFVTRGFGYELIEYICKNGLTQDKDITLFVSQDDAWNFWRAACENAPANSNLILNKVCLNKKDGKMLVQKTVSKMINDNTYQTVRAEV